MGSIEWGAISVDEVGELKDAKLWPDGGRAWDWGETGTRHEPGIQPSDVAELVEHGADVVVLSRGMELRLRTQPETLAWLEGRRVEVRVAETTEAVAVYNELAASGRRVGALIHSTC